MNPEKPSRDEIEIRLTALLLGELPEEEARLLRWTISQDPELAKLHDQLKLAIGLVREVSAKPAEPATLKLSEERRKKLLAHFQTPRGEETFWVKPMRLPSLIPVLAAVAIIVVLAAMLLPALSKAKYRSKHVAQLAAARQREIQDQMGGEDRRAKTPEPMSVTTISGRVSTEPMTGVETVVTGVSVASAPPIASPPASPPPAPIILPQTGLPEAPVETGPEMTVNAGNVAVAEKPDVNSSPRMPLAGNIGGSGGGGGGEGYQQSLKPASQPRADGNGVATDSQELALQSGQRAGFGGPAGPVSEFKSSNSPKDDEWGLVPPPASLPLGQFPANKKLDSAGNNRDLAWDSGSTSSDDLDKRKIVTKEVPLIGDVPVMGNLFQSNGAEASGTTFAPRSAPHELSEGDTILFLTNNLGLPKNLHGAFDFSGGETQLMSDNGSSPIHYAKTEKIDGAIAHLDETRNLERLQEIHQLLYSKIKAESIDSTIPRNSEVQITDVAQPGKSQSWWERLNGEVESTARLSIENDGNIIAGMSTPSSNPSYDPYFIQTTFEVIQSELVLDKVIKNLDLQTAWASRNGGQKLTKDEAVGMLKDRLTLKPVRNTKLIAITVTDSDPKESARLANAVAKAYQDYREKNQKQQITAGLSALNATYAEQDQKIHQLQAQLNPWTTASANTMSVNDAMALYSKLSGRTLLRSSVPAAGLVSVPNSASGSDDDRKLAIERALAADNLSLVNVGDKFVKVVPANKAGLAAHALDNTQDLPLRRPAPNAPIPQPEVLTTANPFSTFTMNVSDVSFQLAAASLEKGLMPQASSIRSEEFINAFDYRDPEAAAGQPIAFNSERAQDPFAQNRDLLRFSIKTAAAGRQPGRPLNLVLLLDNSGSMERADRVAIIRESLRVLAAQLEAQDTITVVTFARTARLWLDGVPGNQAGAELEKVGELTPQGGTNLEEAMRLAYEAAHRHYLANGMNRVVLLTDGAANLGNVDASVLTQKVEANRKQGIALDCFGIGWEDFNDDLLEQLSSHGDGRYAFLNSPEQAASEFAAKLAGALQIAAQDVKVQVEFNPGRVTAYRQIGYAKHQLTKEQFRDNSVAAGEIAAAEAGNALYTVELKPDGSGPLATVRLRYRVPGTTDYRERSWNVEYTGSAPALEKSSAAMRLAGTAAEFAEWLGSSPYAQQVTLDGLLNELNGVPAVYGADVRPKKLEWMIRQAKSVAGK